MMNGETDLKTLLATMHPFLHPSPYVFCSVSQDTYEGLLFDPLGTFREPEGITIIVTQQQAIDSGLPFDTTWACITLTVHSSLSAVGFLAALREKGEKERNHCHEDQQVYKAISEPTWAHRASTHLCPPPNEPLLTRGFILPAELIILPLPAANQQALAGQRSLGQHVANSTNSARAPQSLSLCLAPLRFA